MNHHCTCSFAFANSNCSTIYLQIISVNYHSQYEPNKIKTIQFGQKIGEKWIFEVYIQLSEMLFYMFLYVFYIKYWMFETFAAGLRLSWKFSGDQGLVYTTCKEIFKAFHNFCVKLVKSGYLWPLLYLYKVELASMNNIGSKILTG